MAAAMMTATRAPRTPRREWSVTASSTRELDRAGEEIFEELEKDPDATPKDFEAAVRQLVEENEASLEELQQVAPAEITDDVASLVEALRARAGRLADVPPDADAAETPIGEFEKQNCQ